jgi:hypothetical protein
MQSSENLQFVIYDELGRKQFAQTHNLAKGSSTKSINVSALAKGIYIIDVNNGNMLRKTLKFIKN